MTKPIDDEFAAIPSRQRRWQLRRERDGKCRLCSAWLCDTHKSKRRESCLDCIGWGDCQTCRDKAQARRPVSGRAMARRRAK